VVLADERRSPACRAFGAAGGDEVLKRDGEDDDQIKGRSRDD
jgi:hypothetical protein